jgi:5-methylcytosine-specific restriction endonuclease McrA
MYAPGGATPILMVSGVALPSHLEACRCGARSVDVYSYLEHDNFKGQCTACGATRADWIPHETLGLGRDSRSTRFKVLTTRRFEVFRRDKFMCVHCGSAAPRAGDVSSRIQRLLTELLGEKLVASSKEHAQNCITCGQQLPGMFQVLSFEQLQHLTGDQKRTIFDQLEGRRLTIDHIFPESLLELNGVINGKVELQLVSETFLVTACVECNLGRRTTLETWEEVEYLLRRTVLPGRSSPQADLSHAKEIHFRARLKNAKKIG